MQATQPQRHEIGDLALLRYGERGRPLLYLPTSGGDEREFERYGLARLFGPRIASGRLQLFSVDARGPRTLFDDGKRPSERIASYASLERSLAEELLPWIAERSGTARTDLIGASYGAFVAANLLFKRAERVGDVVLLGGVFQMHHRFDGLRDDDVYFHTPLDYLPRLSDPAALDAIRRAGRLTLFAARGDEWFDETRALAKVLRSRRLEHALDVWDRPHGHHESTWYRQLEKYLGKQ